MRAWVITRRILGGLAVLLGTGSMVMSVAAAGAVAGIDNTVGTKGVVTRAVGQIQSAPGEVAVVADGITVQWELPEEPTWVAALLRLAGTSTPEFVDDVGDFILVVTPNDESESFIGVADPASINAYLDGAPYGVAVREGDEWPTISVPGDRLALAEPATQDVWSAFAVGSPAEIPAEALSDVSMVVMHADATPGIDTSLRLEYRVPQATTSMHTAAIAAAGLAVGGVLLVLLGAFLVVGRRSRGRHA